MFSPQWLGHVDPIETLLPDASDLGEAKAFVEGNVFHHERVRVESNLIKAAPPSFAFRERDQRPANSPSLRCGCHGDVVEQNAIRGLFQDDEPDDVAAFFADPGLIGGNAAVIVVKHWPGWFSDARDVVAVCLLDQTTNRVRVSSLGRADHRRGTSLVIHSATELEPSKS